MRIQIYHPEIFSYIYNSIIKLYKIKFGQELVFRTMEKDQQLKAIDMNPDGLCLISRTNYEESNSHELCPDLYNHTKEQTESIDCYKRIY